MTDVRGTSGDDIFDNRLLKLGPADNIYGEAGNDRFITTTLTNFVGGPGDDILEGGGVAMAVYWTANGSVIVDLEAGYALDGQGGRDTLIGIIGAHGSGFNDRFLGDASNNVFWPNGGNDYVDGRGGEDVVNLVLDPEKTTLTKLGTGHWRYSNPMGSGELVNVELLQYYHNGRFSAIFTLSGDAPRIVKAGERQQLAASAKIETEYYTLKHFGFSDLTIQEAHQPFYYPKVTDTKPAGKFSLDAHNMVTGDFNGDGFEDLLVSWVAFPHVVFRNTPIYPAIYLNNGDGTLGPANVIFKGPVPNRHMNYRSLVADFNGDGVDDILISSMPRGMQNNSNTNNNSSEPISLILSDGAGKMFDASANIAGQEKGGVPQGYTFGHDLSVGDVDGDGDIDFYTAKILLLNDGKGNFSLGTARMPQEARDNSTGVMSSGMGDLDGDGIDDLVVAYFEGSGRYAFLSQGKGIEGARIIRLPEGPFGLVNTKSNYLSVGDLTGDGLADILIACTRADPYYEGQYLQLFVNKGNGVFVEEAGRIDNTPFDKHHGEGQLYLRDMNGDGSVDIVHATGLSYSNTNGIFAGGTDIFLNDGTGFFKAVNPDVFAYASPNQLDGWGFTGVGQISVPPRFVPIQMSLGPTVDLVGTVTTPNYGSDPNISQVTLYLSLNKKPLGRGVDETLIGRANADLIWGLDGNDTIDGGTGSDIAAFSDKFGDVKFEFDGKALIVKTKTEGIDRLTNIETLKFSDSTVSVNYILQVINPVNLLAVSTPEDTARAITLGASTSAYVVSTAAARGTTSINGNTMIYTPSVNYNGTDSVVVTASDGKGGTTTQTINMTVTPVNDAPTFATASQDVSATAGAARTITLAATDVDGDALTYSTARPGKGTATISGSTLTYTPTSSASGSDNFVVTASDGKGGTATQTINATIAPTTDTTAPTVTTFSPTDGATNVTASSNIVVTFNEAIRAGTGTVEIRSGSATGPVVESFNAATSARLTVSGSTLTIDPTSNLAAGTQYFVVLPSGTVRDVAGNAYAGTSTYDFTTAAASAAAATSFRLIAPDGWSGSIGGNGTIFGSAGVQDIRLLSGSIALDGSFNRGGDVVRLAGSANASSASVVGSSAAISTASGVRASVPVGIDGLFMSFDDGARKLLFDVSTGSVRIGTQAVSSVATSMSSAAGTDPLPAGIDPAAAARLTLSGGALGPGETAHVTFGGRATIFGTTDTDVVAIASGQRINVTFDPSFNRGGDVIILPNQANTYTAALVGSAVLLSGADQSLSIPVGVSGLTLRFADVERTLLFTSGAVKIGDQTVGSTATALTPSVTLTSTISIDNGSTLTTFNAATGAINFTDNATRETNVVITNFASNDRISVSGASAANYSFTDGDNGRDMIISFTNTQTNAVNSIVLDDVLVGKSAFIFNYQSAATALGFDFMVFG